MTSIITTDWTKFSLPQLGCLYWHYVEIGKIPAGLYEEFFKRKVGLPAPNDLPAYLFKKLFGVFKK